MAEEVVRAGKASVANVTDMRTEATESKKEDKRRHKADISKGLDSTAVVRCKSSNCKVTDKRNALGFH